MKVHAAPLSQEIQKELSNSTSGAEVAFLLCELSDSLLQPIYFGGGTPYVLFKGGFRRL
jgi:hypothetical protein